MKGRFSRKVNKKKKIEKKEVKSEDGKVEKKLKGDSRFNCHYCNGVNNIASDCMFQKRNVKKHTVKNEPYYVERL